MTEWSEKTIAAALCTQLLDRKCVVLVPNCKWTGHECDVLAVTVDLRIIDIEVKISRSDLKADLGKDKWWKRSPSVWDTELKKYRNLSPDTRREWPPKVWKHYYAMPADLWVPELAADLPQTSGVLLLKQGRGWPMPPVTVHAQRRAKPSAQAGKLQPREVMDIARLASRRMWSAYSELEQERRNFAAKLQQQRAGA